MLQTQWFAERIGQVVMRISPDGKTSRFQITSPDVAQYADSLQTNGYRFKEVVAKPTISRTLNVCTSCEG